jgi:hypothetical protein
VDPDRDAVRAVWLQLAGAREASARLQSPDAVAAGRSAALVLGLADLSADVYEFYVIRRRQLRRGDVRLRVRAVLPAADWRVVDGLPVCTASRVVADLLGERQDGSAIARVCRDAVRAELIDTVGLHMVVAAHADAYGAASPEAFVADLLGGGFDPGGRAAGDFPYATAAAFRRQCVTGS